MEKNETKKLSNQAAEAAIKEYAKDTSKENLTKVVNMLRPSLLLVPAMLHEEEKKPVPLFLKNKEGVAYLAVFTGKEQVPEDMREQTAMVMPFPMCNAIVANDKHKLSGMVVNPYTDNLVLKLELVKRLFEADQKVMENIHKHRATLSPVQLARTTRAKVEYEILPKQLYEEGEEFVTKLCDEKESFVNEIFANAFAGGKGNPYTESDFAVMALNISSELTLVRVDLPGKAPSQPFCYRVYVTFNPETKKAGYYTIEKAVGKEERRLGMIQEDGVYKVLGEAPVEGVELQEIIERAQAVAEENK